MKMSMNIREIHESFCQYQEAIKNYSPATIRSYRHTMNLFLRLNPEIQEASQVSFLIAQRLFSVVTDIQKNVRFNSDSIKGLFFKVEDVEQSVRANSDIGRELSSVVVDIQENMVTRGEFDTKIDVLFEHLDGLAGKNKLFFSELTANRPRVDRLERHVGINGRSSD